MMEGISSVIAVVSLALTCANGILKTISGIKNAPQTIQQISASASSLAKLLEQLRECRDNLHLAADLHTLIEKCGKDLIELEGKLEKASARNNSKIDKFKKSVKVMFQGREWNTWPLLMQQHYAALSLQMNIITGLVLALDMGP